MGTKEEFKVVYQELHSHDSQLQEQNEELKAFRELAVSFFESISRFQIKNQELSLQNSKVLELVHILETETNKRLLSCDHAGKRFTDAETMTEDPPSSESTSPGISSDRIEAQDAPSNVANQPEQINTPTKKLPKKKSSLPDVNDLMTIPPRNSYCLLPKASSEATVVDLDSLASPEKDSPDTSAGGPMSIGKNSHITSESQDISVIPSKTIERSVKKSGQKRHRKNISDAPVSISSDSSPAAQNRGSENTQDLSPEWSVPSVTPHKKKLKTYSENENFHPNETIPQQNPIKEEDFLDETSCVLDFHSETDNKTLNVSKFFVDIANEAPPKGHQNN